jgi:hypothetical protein
MKKIDQFEDNFGNSEIPTSKLSREGSERQKMPFLRCFFKKSDQNGIQQAVSPYGTQGAPKVNYTLAEET